MKRIAALVAAATLMLTLTSVNANASGGDDYNIAAGLAYTVQTGEDISASYSLYTGDGDIYDKNDGCLTDGGYAAADMSAKGYMSSFRGYSRLIGFDFDKQMRVSGVEASFLNGKYGVSSPEFIKVYLSDDGESYTLVYSESLLPLPQTVTKKKCVINFDTPYSARYVRVEYSCEVIVMCDEIAVNGSADPAGCRAVPAYEAPEIPGVYPKHEAAMNGAGSIIKIYDGYYPAEQSRADNTEDELLPYVAYIADGSITDTFFDSVAFVPCHTDYKSGGRLVKTSGKPGAILSDWELYISYTFGDGINLDALEAAVKKRNAALSLTDKVKVFLTLPFPMIQDIPFGDIDGDGRQEYTRTLDERTAALGWYIDRVTSLFAEKGYGSIELCGFYWYREGIVDAESDHEGALIQNVRDYIGSKDASLCLLFDAFYLSEGFENYADYGFDGAVMQPNLIFRDYFKTEMLGSFAGQIKKYHLGVEIETAEPGQFGDTDSNRRYGAVYEAYLYYGMKCGYMDALQTFYQGAGPGTVYEFYSSSDAYMNYLYRQTYRFVKGTYTMEAPRVSETEFTSDGNKTRIDFGLSYEGYIPYLKVKGSSEHGSVTLLGTNVSLYYKPDRDFSGTDTVTLTFTDIYGNVTEAKLTVTVEREDASAEPSSEPQASETPSAESHAVSESGSGSKGTPLIIGVTAAVLLTALALAGVFIVRRKKK